MPWERREIERRVSEALGWLELGVAQVDAVDLVRVDKSSELSLTLARGISV